MSEVKFPPRGFATRFKNQFDIPVYFHAFANEEKAQEDAGRSGEVIPFISLQEHNHLLSQLEERLRVAESKIKEAAWSKQEEIGMRCKQNGHMRDYGKALIEEVRKEREELAAIKEKK